jgi:hypothetical protein
MLYRNMENSSGSILGGIGIALSVISMVYAAVNHKKIKAKCCGRTFEIELDVTSTEQGQRETETKRWSWKDFMNGRNKSEFITHDPRSIVTVVPMPPENNEPVPFIRPPTPTIVIRNVSEDNIKLSEKRLNEINISRDIIKNIYYTPPRTPPSISPPRTPPHMCNNYHTPHRTPPRTPPPSTPPHIPYIVNNQNKKENYDELY